MPLSRLFPGFQQALAYAVILIGISVRAFAQLPQLIPREVLFGDPEIINPKISPDGTRVAYCAPKAKVMNIWIRTIGKKDDRLVTHEKKRGITWFIWAEDNTHIIYIPDSESGQSFHLYSVDLTRKITRNMTPFACVNASVVATDPDYRDQLLVSLNLRDRILSDVYRLNLNTGTLKLDTENPGTVREWWGWVGWLTDHDFNVRGANAVTLDGGRQLLIRNTTVSPWYPLIAWGPEDNESYAIGFTPDNQGLYLADSRNSDMRRLVQLDIASGERRVLVSDPEYDYDISGWLTHPKNRKVQAVSYNRERSYWQVLDQDLEQDFEAIRRIHYGDFEISQDRAGKNWLIGFTADNCPKSYYVYNRETRKAIFLFSEQSLQSRYTLASIKPIILEARDGLTLHGYLTLPGGVEKRNLPMVLLVHGGPWIRDSWGFNRWNQEVQWLANRGYAVLQINYRGSRGFGKKFFNAGNREWGGKMHDDLIDGVNWAVREGIADPERIAIYGTSYGGYAALAGAAFTQDVFACAVARSGISNLIARIKNISPDLELLKKIYHERVGDPETEAEFLKSRSPLFKVDQIKIPLLLAHGAKDQVVKKEESELIVKALQSGGKPVEYLLFPDEGHSFATLGNRLKFYEAVESFLARYLGGREQK
ncbi:MAG TPA: S9 family peptidase [archaeon]|nr:S9 family peptidase [archaeon]